MYIYIITKQMRHLENWTDQSS